MNNNIFFSLIVPVYNVEKYLGRCLDSILSQDYVDYEIICVNDGSTDSSLGILNEYAARYTRIKVVCQENQGLGAARNTGLKYVTGDFVWFIDSDDWIEECALSSINSFIQKNSDCDVVIINAFRTNDQGEKIYFNALAESLRGSKNVNVEAYIQSLLNCDSLPSAWLKLFKSSVIVQYSFSKGFYEDVPLVRVFHRADLNVGYLAKPFYNYFYREGSIMTKVDYRLLDMFHQYDLIYEEYKDLHEYNLGLTHLLFYWTGKQLSNVEDTSFAEIKEAIYKEFKKRKKKVLPFGRLMLSNLTLRRKTKLMLFKLKFNL